MVRKIKVRDIHRCATAYNKIKSRDLLEALYAEFTSWEGLLDFEPRVTAPNGEVITLDRDPAMVVGVAEFPGQGCGRHCATDPAQRPGTRGIQLRAGAGQWLGSPCA